MDALAGRAALLRCQMRAVEKASEKMEESQEAQCRTQDLGHPLAQERIPAGAVVYKVHTARQHKLDNNFVGPYRVIGDASEDPSANYVVARLGADGSTGQELERSVPRDQLYWAIDVRPELSRRQRQLFAPAEWEAGARSLDFHQPGPLEFIGDNAVVCESLVNTQHGKFAVSHIDGSRLGSVSGNKKLKPQVRVHWLGYEEPTWEDEDAFASHDLAELRRKEVRVARTLLGAGRPGGGRRGAVAVERDREPRGVSIGRERRATSAERRAPSAERRASSVERRAPSAERRATSPERRAPSAERRAPSVERRASSDEATSAEASSVERRATSAER